MNEWSVFVHRAYETGARFVALVSAAAAIYIVIGSLTFPMWWYGYFWDGGYGRLEYIKQAIFVLLENDFWLALLILACFFVSGVIVIIKGRWILPKIGNYAGLMIFGSVMAIAVVAVVLFHSQRGPYVVMTSAFQNVKKAVQDAGAVLLPPGINPPFDFRYLDRSGVEALYSQVEPELQEQQRVVKGSGTVKAGAGLGIGYAGLEVKAKRSTASESTFARNGFSPERKCVEIMKYVRNKWPGNYYSTYPDWLATQLYKQLARSFGGALRPASGPNTVTTTSQTASTATPINVRKQAAILEKKSEETLKGQLQTLQGLVFVDGEFRISRSNAGDVLDETFSERPLKVSFRVFVPQQALRSLPAAKVMRFRVFGSVTKPLEKDGVVDVQALAIF